MTNGTIGNYDYYVTRFTSDGTLDSTFSDDGVAVLDIAGRDDIGGFLSLQADDKVVIVGHSDDVNGDHDLNVIRFDTEGNLDTLFDSDGILTTPAPSNRLQNVLGTAAQDDGKLLVFAGWSLDFDVLRIELGIEVQSPAGSGSASLDVTDNDVAGFTIVESAGNTSVDESGTTDNFTVVLDRQPLSDVVLTVGSADTGEATVDTATLTFTPANWNAPQTVTVTGVNDDVDDGDQPTVITVAVDDANSNDAFDNVADQTVTVTTTDDDGVGFTIVESSGDTSVDESATTDSFTVVLDSEPVGDVVLDVSSGDTGEATVDKATLTFTAANWDTPQTVTVTGVDDVTVDGSQNTTITVSIDADATDDNLYDAVGSQTLTATTTDDDTAAFTIVESAGNTAVDESATTDTFTVVLDAQPLTDVVLTVVSGDTGEATVDLATLTFTSANWDTAQTVTVTGVDDVTVDGPQTTTITVAIDDANSDNAFDPVADQTVSVTTTDNDVAAFTITESAGNTSVDESGTTDSFTVVLDAQPLTDVVLTVVSDDTGEATVDTATLTFTPANWDTAQTVTVTGVDDVTVDGSQTTTITVAIDDASSDDAFDNVADQTLTVTTTDNDVAGFTIVESAGNTSVDESGTTDTFTVVLDRQPLSDVVLTVGSADTGEATVDTATLTFTPANWNAPQTVTVTGVNDDVDDGDQPTVITVAVDDANSNDAFDNIADQTVTVTTTDDDGVGFTIVESSGDTSVDESATTDSFTVVLDSEPVGDVVLDVSSGDTGEATVDKATLTFTAANWDTPQTVTVTGVDDVTVDGSQNTTITVSIDADATDDNLYDAVGSQTLTATTTDDDTAAFTIVESAGNTAVDESATTDTFTVVLDAQPLTDVVLTVVSGDTGEATVDLATLTFTSANWDTAQTVTVTGVDDVAVDGPQTTTITVAIDDANSDNAFDPVADQTVSVTTTDNDVAAFTITESAGNTSVDESGTTDSFTVVLDAQPLTDVVLTVVSDDTGEATVDTATLTFTPANWDTAQTVTVTGVDDVTVDGSQTTTITVAIDDASSDDAFDNVADQTLTVTTTDNDVAGFTIVESAGNTSVDESGTTDTFTVVLDRQPLSDVVLTVGSADTGEATVDTATLTFTPANWNAPQTVTVTGVNDDVDDGDQPTVITVAVDDANSNDAFDNIADQTVTVTTTDDDGVGFTIVESSGDTSVDESATTDSFTVVLDSEPVGDVVLDVSSGDTGEATVDKATLTFTAANWDTPQTVTVTGVDDVTVDGSQNTTITVSIDADATDDNLYDAVGSQTLTATTTDDDTAAFTIVESAGNTAVDESATTDTFTVVLDAQPLTDVVLTVVSGDTGEATVDLATLTFTSANWDTAQTVTVTGVDDVTVDGPQTTTITVAIDDANSDNAFDPVADQTVSVTTTDNDVAAFTITESAGNTSVDESATTDTFTVVLDAQPFSVVVINLTNPGADEISIDKSTLTFTAANWNVAQTVTVTGVDDIAVDLDQATTISLAVNDAASDDVFDAFPDQTLVATTVDNELAGFIVSETTNSTVVSEGGITDRVSIVLIDQPLENVVITAASGDSGEASVSNSTLTFTPSNWNTPQTVIVAGVDDVIVDGEQLSTVTVSIDDANSQDAFAAVADQLINVTTIDNEIAGFSISQTAGATTVSESGSTDSFVVVLDFEPLSNVVLNVASGDTGEASVDKSRLTFTPSNWDTPQTVTVTGEDDLTVDGFRATTVTISIEEPLTDDLYDSVADRTVTVTTLDDDVAAFTVTKSAENIEVSETGTSETITVVLDRQPLSDVSFSVMSNDAGEVAVDKSTLTFTPANWDTVQTVTVTGVDDVTVDGPQDSTVTVSVAANVSNDAFDALAGQTVSVTNTDDDIAGFVITQSDGSTTVSETGSTDSFDVALSRQPLTTVVLTIELSEQTEVSVNRTFVIFTTDNWNIPQTVVVTGKDDLITDGDQSTLLTVSIDQATSDSAFDSVADQTLTAVTIDNDVIIISIDGSGNLQIADNSPLGLAESLTLSTTNGSVSIFDPVNTLLTSVGTQISAHEVQVPNALITSQRIVADLRSGDDSLDATALTTGLSVDVRAGSGNDTIIGSAQADTLNGDSGDDLLIAGAGDDQVTGGSGDDTVDGESGNDDLAGGRGFDTLIVAADSNLIINSTITVGDGVDSHREFEQGLLSGGDGHNRLDARLATIPVTLMGGRGNDTLLGGPRGDRLDGGLGTDFAEIVGSNITLTNSNAPGVDIDAVISVEGLLLVAEASGSTIDASAYTLGPVTIIGSSGKDTLKGGAGDDLILAGAGADNVSGGAGNDAILAGGGADTVSGGDGDDLIFGGRGNDLLSGENGDDLILGGIGKDVINGGAGEDGLFGGRNSDTIRGGANDDLIFGSSGRDVLDGESGQDTLFGNSGRDSLFGGLGDDVLNGVLRDDSFNQQVGQDTLNGAGAAPQNRPSQADRVPETARFAEPDSLDSNENEIDGLFSDPLLLELSLL